MSGIWSPKSGNEKPVGLIELTRWMVLKNQQAGSKSKRDFRQFLRAWPVIFQARRQAFFLGGADLPRG
jgi:hypothetical protein